MKWWIVASRADLVPITLERVALVMVVVETSREPRARSFGAQKLGIILIRDSGESRDSLKS
jgi:hypothetical protein